MKKNTPTSSAFSIIEVLIGIFVFSLGLVSIFALLTSALSVNDLNKNSIIASNLAREQIELLRNIRDRNYSNLKIWNQHDPNTSLVYNPPIIDDTIDPDMVFLENYYYTIGLNYSTGEAIVDTIGTSIPEGVNELSEMGNMSQDGYRLCNDSENRYVLCNTGLFETPFYRYIYISPARDELGNTIPDAMQVTSRVIWYKRGYHEYDIQTIITDWRRI